MKLDICHITRYRYAEPVTDSVNEIRLSPRTNYRQACYHHEIKVEPAAALFSYEDYFGNRIHAFTVNPAHRELSVTVRSTVVTHDNDKHRRKVLSPDEDWQTVRSEAVYDRFAEYLQPTAYIVFDGTFIENDAVKEDGIGVFDWVLQTAKRIYEQYEYNPNTTGVHTTVSEFYRLRRGVCQDFAHLMITLCRMKGVPARYVSGYHFVGDLQSRTATFEQASHAWIEAYIPGTGWIGFDPTNNCQVDDHYVKLGHGRDYLDIVPMKGVYRGTPVQTMDVTVDVRKLSD